MRLGAEGTKKATRPPESGRKLKIPGYKLVGRLGSGGQGNVYKAVQISMNRPVAIKVVPPSADMKATDIARFLREARVLARLRHENIVGAIDYGELSGVRYLVMEYIEGDSVLDLIQREGSLGARRAVEITLQICRALGYVAKYDIIHRDIKPANIVITDENRAVLVDFGLARHEGSDGMVTIAGMTIGTPHYMAPEQIRGEEEIDIRGDLYALGGTFFHMLTGRVPFPSASKAEILASHLREAIQLPDELPAGVPEDLFAIVRRAMRKKPEERYQDANEMVADLLASVERMADTGEGDSREESLELFEEIPAAGASVKERIRGLTEERDRLQEENRGLKARVNGVRKKAKELLDQGSAELEKVRGARQQAEERLAGLEVKLKTAEGRSEALEDESRSREGTRAKAADEIRAAASRQAELEEKLRDIEAGAARDAADALTRRRAAEARIRELTGRITELESAESGHTEDLETVREESRRARRDLSRERDRLTAERKELEARACEAAEEAELAKERQTEEVAGLSREREELRTGLRDAERSIRTLEAEVREATGVAARERERLKGEREGLDRRVAEAESRLSEAEANAARLGATREVETEAAPREAASLRERISGLTRKQAEAEAKARSAAHELERVVEEARLDREAAEGDRDEIADRLSRLTEERREEREEDRTRRREL